MAGAVGVCDRTGSVVARSLASLASGRPCIQRSVSARNDQQSASATRNICMHKTDTVTQQVHAILGLGNSKYFVQWRPTIYRQHGPRVVSDDYCHLPEERGIPV